MSSLMPVGPTRRWMGFESRPLSSGGGRWLLSGTVLSLDSALSASSWLAANPCAATVAMVSGGFESRPQRSTSHCEFHNVRLRWPWSAAGFERRHEGLGSRKRVSRDCDMVFAAVGLSCWSLRVISVGRSRALRWLHRQVTACEPLGTGIPGCRRRLRCSRTPRRCRPAAFVLVGVRVARRWGRMGLGNADDEQPRGMGARAGDC